MDAKLTQLRDAISAQDVASIERLVDEGVELTSWLQITDPAENFPGIRWCPLSFACYRGKFKAATALIALGANVQEPDGRGRTPLHFAAARDKKDACISLLLAKGASVFAEDTYKALPLHAASRSGNITGAKLLVQAGGDVNAVDMLGQSAFHHACSRGGSVMARFLFNLPGMNVTAVDQLGRNALHHAGDYHTPDVIRFLLETGKFDPDAKDETGKTALSGACRSFHQRQQIVTADRLYKSDPESEGLALLVEATSTLPEGGDEAAVSILAAMLRPFLRKLLRNPTGHIPPSRKTLRFLLNSPAAEPLWSSVAAEVADKASAVALPADIDDVKNLRLRLMREDAWERRGHLVFDRAMEKKYAEQEEAKRQKKK